MYCFSQIFVKDIWNSSKIKKITFYLKIECDHKHSLLFADNLGEILSFTSESQDEPTGGSKLDLYALQNLNLLRDSLRSCFKIADREHDEKASTCIILSVFADGIF